MSELSRRRVLALTGVALGGLAGCSGASDDETPTDEPTRSPATTATSTPTDRATATETETGTRTDSGVTMPTPESDDYTKWLGDGMGPSNAAGYWSGVSCWSQSRYAAIAADLPETATNQWQEGSAYLPTDAFREAIDVETGVFSDDSIGLGFATAGSVDIETLVDAKFPAPRMRQRLESQGSEIDVSVEAVETHRGLDVYRQALAVDGPTRAIAIDGSTCVVSNFHTEPATAVETAKTIADNWLDGAGRYAATSDAFDRFTSMLDPGFVAYVTITDVETPRGWTLAVDGETAVSREVVVHPRLRADQCEDESVERSVEDYMDQFPGERFDPVTDVTATVEDGAGVIELTIPIDEVGPGWQTAIFYRQGVFAACVE